MRLLILPLLLLLLAATAVECALPREISIAAVFDHDQDRMHELAFRYQLSGSPYCWAKHSALAGRECVFTWGSA